MGGDQGDALVSKPKCFKLLGLGDREIIAPTRMAPLKRAKRVSI